MPVKDVNATRLGTDLLNVFESAETTSEFWKINADLVAVIFVSILILGILLAIVVFARYGIKMALKR